MRERLYSPIGFSKRFGGWVYTEPGYQIPFLALTETEASTLRRTLLAAQAYLSPNDAEAIRYLAIKLSPYIRGLPVRGTFTDNKTEWFLSGHPTLSSQTSVSENLLAQIRQSLNERRRLHLVYYGAHSDTVSERMVQPYLLLNWRGELYLIAHCETRRALRHFFLPRIQKWTLLEPAHSYEIPSDFDADQYLRAAFELRQEETEVTVRARFSSQQSRWIRERHYHPSQQTEEQGDGSLIAIFTVAGTAEIFRWLLSFGAEVEILEPESLREQVQRECERMTAQYAKK
ncbi:MAG: WYL domain-containing protein [Proteobacteria bacterium]|nr:MAG: WYL domain-containing protein [Pseudomonadota bacterium]